MKFWSAYTFGTTESWAFVDFFSNVPTKSRFCFRYCESFFTFITAIYLNFFENCQTASCRSRSRIPRKLLSRISEIFEYHFWIFHTILKEVHFHLQISVPEYRNTAVSSKSRLNSHILDQKCYTSIQGINGTQIFQAKWPNIEVVWFTKKRPNFESNLTSKQSFYLAERKRKSADFTSLICDRNSVITKRTIWWPPHSWLQIVVVSRLNIGKDLANFGQKSTSKFGRQGLIDNKVQFEWKFDIKRESILVLHRREGPKKLRCRLMV